MATDDLIVDITNRLGFSERDEIARRKALYYAKSRRGLAGAVLYSAIVLLTLCVLGASLVTLDIKSLDDMAGDLAHIWGLITCVYFGIWAGETSFKKTLLKKISEGALNE